MPVMLEYADEGLATLNIGSLKPGEEVTIVLTLEWLLTVVSGRVRLTIPTVVGQRYGKDGGQGRLLEHRQIEHNALCEYPITARFIFAADWYAQARFAVPGFAPVFARTQDGRGTIDIRSGFADRDLVVTASGVTPQPLSLLMADEGRGYRALTVLPVPEVDTAAVTPLNLCVLVDCSGSMAGAAIEEARRALKGLTEYLSSEDRISLTCFGSSVLGASL